MNALVEKWADAYAHWVPAQQVGFSAVLVLAVTLLVVTGGWWLAGLAKLLVVLIRGWPPVPKSGDVDG